jgi:hypothetical protein
MGEVEKSALLFWCQKIVNDPEMLAEDPRGVKIGAPGFRLDPGEDLKTFCNIGAQRICRGLNYNNLDDMVADEMYKYLIKNWIMPIGNLAEKFLAAYSAAVVGDLCVLAWYQKPHGHVAVCAPLRPMLYSGKWSCYVPQVANVGKTNGFTGANYAFTEPPDVFVLGRTIA